MQMRSTTLESALFLAVALNSRTPRLQSGSEKQRNKDMPKHNTTLAFAITMAKVLHIHTQKRKSGTEKQQNKDILKHSNAKSL